MKHSRNYALAGLLAFNCTAFAAAPAEGWYAGLLGGVSFSPNAKVQVGNPQDVLAYASSVSSALANSTYVPIAIPTTGFSPFYGTYNGTLSHKIGGNFAIDAGYRYCNFRFEGELLYNYTPFSKGTFSGLVIGRHVTPTNPLRLSGSTTTLGGLFNVFYDFYSDDDDPSFVPYIGIGIGYGYIRNSVHIAVPYLYTTAFGESVTSTKTRPIGQAILGLSYYYSDYTALNIDYRYMTSQSSNTSSSSSNSFNVRLQNHSLNVGINYWFADS